MSNTSELKYLDKDDQIIVNVDDYIEFKKWKEKSLTYPENPVLIGDTYFDLEFKRFWGLHTVRYYYTQNQAEVKVEDLTINKQMKIHMNNLWPQIQKKIEELYSKDSENLEKLVDSITKRRKNWLFKLYEKLYGEIKIGA